MVVCINTGSSQASSQAWNTVHRMYSAHQKKKIADYARHYGVRAGVRHFGVHHQNVVKKNLDAMKGRMKQRNNKGQGCKLSYSVELDEKLLQWVLEKRDLQCH